MGRIAVTIHFSMTLWYELSEVLDPQCLEICFKQKQCSLVSRCGAYVWGISPVLLGPRLTFLKASPGIHEDLPAQNFFVCEFSDRQQVTAFSHSCVNSQ